MTQEFVLPEKWCIKPKNKEEVDKIFQFEGIGKHGDSKNIHYYQHFPAIRRDYTAYAKIQEGYTEITFEQFKEHILKEKLTIDYTIPGTKLPRELKDIEYRCTNWDSSIGLFRKNFSDLVSYGSKEYKGETYILAETKDYEGTIYYMFKLTDLQKLTNMEEQEIEGYKLLKEENVKLAAAIEGFIQTGFSNLIGRVFTIKENSEAIAKWKRAEVFDSWFEPVYKTKEQVISINGKFNLTVKDKKVFHKSEDITEYIKYIGRNWGNLIENHTIGRYDFNIKDMILSRTGCESKETYLSDWLKVYDLIKN